MKDEIQNIVPKTKELEHMKRKEKDIGSRLLMSIYVSLEILKKQIRKIDMEEDLKDVKEKFSEPTT